ncbi:MAG: chromosomal replication initiator protein DnaA [Dehalococcoidia bacterium]
MRMLSSRLSDPRELARTWHAVLGQLQLEVSAHNFDTWLRDTRAIRLDDHGLVVEARSALTCDWLNERLSLLVNRAVRRVLGEDFPIRFVPRGADEPPGAAAAQAAVAIRPLPVAGTTNAAFTFARYQRAEGNVLAIDACSALLQEPEGAISPVVLYGPPGMGKTHLLHAITCAATSKGWRTACLSAEEFTTRYQAALRASTVEEFQSLLRSVRLFAIDDIQYLVGKKATLAELVHTIDAILNAGGHVIAASEANPFELDLPDRLVSRLASGLITRIGPFNALERREYVEREARELRTALPQWAVDRIASVNAPSVRILQGALHAALALQRSGRLEIARLDEELMRMAVTELAEGSGIATRTLLEAVARRLEVPASDLAGRSRSPAVSRARALAVVALHRHGNSYAEIGRILGGRDRSTIKQLAARGERLIEAEPALLELLSTG